MTIKGIDVASYQSTTPNLAGLDFCVVKATEKTGYVNPKHAAQVAHARAAGLVVGHYHFVSGDGMDAQADYFLSHAGARPGEFLALDWESPDVTDAEKDEFIRHLKSKVPGVKVILYCNLDYWKHRDHTSFAGDGLWIADPDAPAGHPRVTHPWVIHQYGINDADLDVAAFASRAEMQAWAAGKPPVITPTPAKPVTPPAHKPPRHPTPTPKPVAKPVVDLSNLVAAARRDPHLRQGGTTHPADVKIVEAALHAEGLLSATYAHDGSFGSSTVAAYRNWQIRCNYTGSAADGIPGKASLTKLGAKHGFTVKA